MSGVINTSTENKNANYLLKNLEDARVGEGFTLPTIATSSVAGSFIGAVVVDGGVLKRVVA